MGLSVRPARQSDRQNLANLIHFEVNVHRHLDWRPPLDWLGSTPYLVAFQNDQLVASLACPPDPAQVAWVRLFVAAYHTDLQEAWEALWPAALVELHPCQGLQWAAAIPLQSWFEGLLARHQFVQTNRIVLLSWEAENIVKRALPPHLLIRQMSLEDLDVVFQVDNAAFDRLWQNSLLALNMAYHQSALATVACVEERVVGYQISTASSLGAHLARLAVLPEYQGGGIGGALLQDLLWQCRQRNAQFVTVNTQVDNLASLSLYDKAGFRTTGEEYPIYQYELN